MKMTVNHDKKRDMTELHTISLGNKMLEAIFNKACITFEDSRHFCKVRSSNVLARLCAVGALKNGPTGLYFLQT